MGGVRRKGKTKGPSLVLRVGSLQKHKTIYQYSLYYSAQNTRAKAEITEMN